ncbi:MAG: rRNA methyltransferase [Henriciella sp.]|jgi:16S rRNA (cytosine967-C5)-methyltransferase|uniref:RsmB/NOP family class I SAM-dependent RNA methyltransferase n=1 Tax=Henriciella sp. TaxID=1968823 RepID=UPI000C0E77AB|nr:RsmB/NOP family class I SAM-dependent RNA methyltransferase [Henriciella sp.]MAN72575.1 rRNA methyltransferase [Henriciella sp.]MBF33113.1 rRNA methyltransferase [Hyphomonadaceae bacterium]PHR82980.1 MAG: rRNA methyltransferase [Henriciella sp.]|tara:strand:+ start:20955 stop:22235 length:1281 start_codon:yes stop_codon:yes gene_type:complete
MSAAQSRQAAADLLIETLDNRRTLDEAMDTSELFGGLTGPDRGFARAMASAALRQLGRIDKGLAPFLNRPIETATPPARALLRVGAAQSWLMETPPHAVVSETVNAAKQWARARSAAGFLNAVLRKVVADRTAFDAAPGTAVWPDWLTVELMTSLGVEGATALAELQMSEPDLDLTPRDKGFAEELGKRLGAKPVGLGSLRVASGDVPEVEGYRTGDWWVQDAAAAIPAELLDVKPGERVFDLCAAPGGKTMQLAAAGAAVVAVDRSKARLTRVEENLDRTGLAGRVEILAEKAEDWTPDALADAVLLDAPCSALGTLRRHPEGAWIKSPDEIARFPQVQLRLLEAAARLVKPGGRIVYCVCTPLKREGADVVTKALASTGLERLAISAEEAGPFVHGLTADGDLLTLPHGDFAHDAFYIARLVKP